MAAKTASSLDPFTAPATTLRFLPTSAVTKQVPSSKAVADFHRAYNAGMLPQAFARATAMSHERSA